MANGSFVVRAGHIEDFDRLKAIEVDAFETLLAAGGVFGEADSSSDAELQHYIDEGMLLVAADTDDNAIGYVGAILVGNSLHVAEIDVSRDWQRKGVGRALVTAVLVMGAARNLRSATLTTDRLVPFNAPFYASLGFRILEPSELSDRLRVILDKEHAAGFDPARRVAMMCDLGQYAP